MAKGAANADAMGKLHSKLADVFVKVLERYMQRMEALDKINTDDIEGEMLKELFQEGTDPNPAMLNAVSTFLKNNEIRFDDEKVGAVGELQQRLEERRKQRSNVVSLTVLPAIGE